VVCAKHLDAAERRAARDSLIVTLGGQLQRAVGLFTALALRWGLDPGRLGVYTGLRLFLDNTNRSSLGVSLGAVQEIPILRAAGREAESEHLARVAHTTNTLTCLLYALGLLACAAWRAPSMSAHPLGQEWTWGLVAVALLTILRRYESFLIAVHRARQEFALTTKVELLESVISALAVSLGLSIAGFWGLLGALAVIMSSKILYLHAKSTYRLGYAWDWPRTRVLMLTGLPILANTAVFGCVLGIDRALILGFVPNGEQAVGLYSIALLGSGWSLDLAGRVVLVLYPYFQTTLGATSDEHEVARRAMRATEAQVPMLAVGAALMFVFGPALLGWLMPRFVGGLPALRPLLWGTLILSLAWPARQMLIAVHRPFRLLLATGIGLGIVSACGAAGALHGGMFGVAWGMSLGYTCVFLTTGAAAFVPLLGWRVWLRHVTAISGIVLWFVCGALLADQVNSSSSTIAAIFPRTLTLAIWSLPAFWRYLARFREFFATAVTNVNDCDEIENGFEHPREGATVGLEDVR
jgi:O-antigen/teichoic acid export membrane protein